MENTEQQPSIISLLESNDSTRVLFADGLQKIPKHILNDLGKEYFEQRAEKFINLKYAEFIDGWTRMQQKQQLNNFQENFIGNHFG